MVELYISEVGLTRIAGSHLGTRVAGVWNHWEWKAHTGVYVPMIAGTDTTLQVIPLDSKETRNFLDQYIPALTKHLKEKGWDKMYVQFIADEPADGYETSYLPIAEYVKKLNPEIRFLEALHRSPKIAEKI
jgi:hypothetical protein